MTKNSPNSQPTSRPWPSAKAAVVVALTTLFVFASVSSAYAQSRVRLPEVNQRLIRVENILDQSLLELLQNIRKLEREIKVLRGEMENQANAVSRLKTQLSNQSAGPGPAEVRQLEDRLLQIESRLRAPSDDSSGDGGLLLPDPSDETATARAAVSGAGGDVVASEGETIAYQRAKQLLDNQRYEQAIDGFETFLTSYPSGAYADNALYWQGEAMYAKRSFEEAIINFNVLISSYPESTKIADAKLKIAFALYEQSRFADARSMLENVASTYDGRSAAVLAQQRLASMDQAGL